MLSICWIDGIVLLIGYFSFRRLRRLMIIKKRYPSIVLIESKLGWALSFILVPFLYTTYIELEMFSDFQWYIDRITFCLYPMAHWIVGCEVYRLWLVCYDLNHLHLTQSTEWQSQIDDSLSTDSHWWTTQSNRMTYGNQKWLRNRVIAWCLFAGLTPSIIYQIWGWTPITQIFDAVFYAAPIMFELGTFYLCPKVADTFMFMFEFKTTSFIFVTGLGGYLVGMILMFFDLFVAQTIMALSGQWGLSVVSIVSTLYIPHKISNDAVWHRELHRQGTMSRSRSVSQSSRSAHSGRERSRSHTKSSVRTRSPSSPNNHEGAGPETDRRKSKSHTKSSKSHSKSLRRRRGESNYVARLKAIMLKEEKFGQFVHWMYGEFSSESILSFIEFVQFKQRAIEVLQELPEFATEQKNQECPYKFYSKIPKSSIVYSAAHSVSSQSDHYPDPEISHYELSPMSTTSIAGMMMSATTVSPRPSFLFKMSSLLHLGSIDETTQRAPDHNEAACHQPQCTPSNHSNGPHSNIPHSNGAHSNGAHSNGMHSNHSNHSTHCTNGVHPHQSPKLGLSRYSSSQPHSQAPTPAEGSVGTHDRTHTNDVIDHPMNLEIEFSENLVDPRIMTLRTAAAKLHVKYLMICAEFEINISAGLRRSFYELEAKQWDLDCLELVHLFDEVTECMFSYMKQSYLRFEKSEQ